MGFALPAAEAAVSVSGLAGGGALGGMGSFLTADGRWFYFNIWSNEQFRKLFHLAGMPEVADSAEYDSRAKRGVHAAELNELLSYWVSTRTLDELVEIVQREQLPAAPLHASVDELVHDPQVKANEVLVRVEHPTKGPIWQLGPGFELDGDRGSVSAAPLLGQDTDTILSEHGYNLSEIAAMRQSGAIV
jgi:crotonobetainyl-CoA:carnitine CoA-transferase CaiB-like acyl-CoA transferase